MTDETKAGLNRQYTRACSRWAQAFGDPTKGRAECEALWSEAEAIKSQLTGVPQRKPNPKAYRARFKDTANSRLSRDRDMAMEKESA